VKEELKSIARGSPWVLATWVLDIPRKLAEDQFIGGIQQQIDERQGGIMLLFYRLARILLVHPLLIVSITAAGVPILLALRGVKRSDPQGNRDAGDTAESREPTFIQSLKGAGMDMIRIPVCFFIRNSGRRDSERDHRLYAYCNKFSCLALTPAAGVGPGARRAIRRPSTRSSPITNSVVLTADARCVRTVTRRVVTGRCEEIDNSKGLFVNL
jgi:hypothetical protein